MDHDGTSEYRWFLIQVTCLGESFRMQSAIIDNASADEEEDDDSTDDESSGEIDMGLPDAADMTAMLGEFDDCIASNACEFPERQCPLSPVG